MDKTNKDYKALKDFLKHIEKINQINQELKDYQTLLKQKQAITFDYHDEKYPYKEAIDNLKNDGEKPTAFVVLLTGIVAGVLSLVAGFIPIILVYILLTNWLSTSFDLIIQYASYVIGVIVLIFTFLKIVSSIFHRFMALRLSSLSKKREEDIELAKNQSIKMIESETHELNEAIKTLEQAIAKTEKSKNLLESKMDKDTFLHEHYYQSIYTLIEYFEHGRVDTIKEAINLLESEHAQKAYFTRLMVALKDPNRSLDSLLDLSTPIVIDHTLDTEPNLVQEEAIIEPTLDAEPEEETEPTSVLETKEEPIKKVKEINVDDALLKAVVHETSDEEPPKKKKSKKSD
jgi:hypothetical protein